MKTPADYIDKAKENLGLTSDRSLDEHFGFRGQAAWFWRKRKARPSRQNMLRLADAAGIDRREALLDLALWEAEDAKEPETVAVLERIRQAIVAAVALAILAVSANGATATEREQNTAKIATTVYYRK